MNADSKIEKDLKLCELQWLQVLDRLSPGYMAKRGVIVEVEEFDVEGVQYAAYAVCDDALAFFWLGAFIAGAHCVELAVANEEVKREEANEHFLRAA